MSFKGFSTMVQFASLSLCHTSLSWLGVGDCLELIEWDFTLSKLRCTWQGLIGSFFWKSLIVGLGESRIDKDLEMASSPLNLSAPSMDGWQRILVLAILELLKQPWWFGWNPNGTYNHTYTYEIHVTVSIQYFDTRFWGCSLLPRAPGLPRFLDKRSFSNRCSSHWRRL